MQLTASDFEMVYDSDHTFPFFETEDAAIMAYGHHDPASLAALVKQYDDLCNGSEAYGVPHSPDDVKHVWAVIDGASEDEWRASWGGVAEDTPGAIPLTVIIR